MIVRHEGPGGEAAAGYCLRTTTYPSSLEEDHHLCRGRVQHGGLAGQLAGDCALEETVSYILVLGRGAQYWSAWQEWARRGRGVACFILMKALIALISSQHFGLSPKDVDIMMGTFTKSFGSAGGYIAADKAIIDTMRAQSHANMYASSVSPPGLSSIL